MVLWSAGKLAQNYSIFCQTAASWRKSLRANSTLLIVWKSRGEWHRICSNSIYPVFTVFVRYHKRWVKGYIYLLVDSYRSWEIAAGVTWIGDSLLLFTNHRTWKDEKIDKYCSYGVQCRGVQKEWKSGNLFPKKCALDMIVKHWKFVHPVDRHSQIFVKTRSQ